LSTSSGLPGVPTSMRSLVSPCRVVVCRRPIRRFWAWTLSEAVGRQWSSCSGWLSHWYQSWAVATVIGAALILLGLRCVPVSVAGYAPHCLSHECVGVVEKVRRSGKKKNSGRPAAGLVTLHRSCWSSSAADRIAQVLARGCTALLVPRTCLSGVWYRC